MHIDEGDFALFGIEEEHYRDWEEVISDFCDLLEIWVTGKWEGHSICYWVTDGRPKSAPIARWSRWFICSLNCVLMSYLLFRVPFMSLVGISCLCFRLRCFAVLSSAIGSCWRFPPFFCT